MVKQSNVQLLFFETFAHDQPNDDLNFDLIRFTSFPVVIREIRIIPNLTAVCTDGSTVSQGYTSPQAFTLDIFANNLGRSAACTFEKVGCFEYRHDSDVKFSLTSYLATDGLLVRGRYRRLSLAVYGEPVPGETAGLQQPSITAESAPIQTTVAVTDPLAVSGTAAVMGPVTVPLTVPPGPPLPIHGAVGAPPLAPSSIVSPPLPPPGLPPPFSQPPLVIGPAVAVWPTPPIQLMPTVVAFNPLVPPPLSIGGASSAAPPHPPLPSVYGAAQPAVPGAGGIYGGASVVSSSTAPPFDVSRPPPTLTAPPPLHGTSTSNRTQKKVSSDRRRSRSRRRSSSASSSRRRRHGHRSPSPATSGADVDGRKRQRRRIDSDGRSEGASGGKSRVAATSGDHRRHQRRSPLWSSSRRRDVDVPSSRSRGRTSPPRTKVTSHRSPATKEMPSSSKDVTSSSSTTAEITPNLADDAPPSIRLDDCDYANSDEETLAGRLNFETISDEECETADAHGEIDENELNEDIIKHARFNPCEFNATETVHFEPPHLTLYERNLANFQKSLALPDGEAEPSEFSKFFSAIKNVGDDRSEKWILTIERILPDIPKMLAFLTSKSDEKEIVNILLVWVSDALDMKLALKQEQPIFIVRHMKVGVKLATCLAMLSEGITGTLIEVIDVQHKLFDLYNAPYMSVPMRMQILKALDSTLFFPAGFRHIIDGKTVERPSTVYQRIAASLTENPGSRVLIAVNVVLNKVRFCRLLNIFSIAVAKLAEREEFGDEADQSDELRPALCHENPPNFVEILQEILKYYDNASDLLVQPTVGCLPVSKIFEAPNVAENPYSFVYRQFVSMRLFESILLLITHPNYSEEMKLVGVACKFIDRLLCTNDGLVFLIGRKYFTNSLIKLTLTTYSEDNQDDESASILQQVAIDMAYHLRVIQLVDFFMHKLEYDDCFTEIHNTDILEALQCLYVLTFDKPASNFTNQSLMTSLAENRGKRAVVRILAMCQNLSSLMPFIELSSDEEFDKKVKKSASAGYATELLLLVLQMSDSIDLLKNYGAKLLAISSKDSSSKICEIRQWVEVLSDSPNFTQDSVENLCEKMKNFVEQESFGAVIPPGLVTTLRMLKFLATPPRSCDVENFDYEKIDKISEIKYEYGLMQMIHFKAVRTLVQIIDKLAELHALNWQQGISLNSRCGSLFYACVVPALNLIKSAVTFMISCRKEYQDVACIKPLMKMYAVCCSLLPSSGLCPLVLQVQKEIVATLLAFTQNSESQKSADSMDVNHSEDCSGSLWTLAVAEILKFSSESVCNFVGGLSALSELLPLPLPLLTKEPLPKIDVDMASMKRQKWSQHLIPLADQIELLIKHLMLTTNSNLMQTIRRLCLQLCDLAPEIATIITKAILSVFLDGCDSLLVHESTKDDKKSTASAGKRLKLPANANLARSLNLTSYLSSYAPFKCVLIELMRNSNESKDEMDRFAHILPNFLEIFNFSSSSRSHQLCQQQIVSTLQSLCDENITLLGPEGSFDAEQIRQSSLPEHKQLQTICASLLKHTGSKKQAYATVLPALRILLTLCEHEYGFYNTKTALQSERRCFLSLIERLIVEFSGRSSDCVCTLNTLLELIKITRMPTDHVTNFLSIDFLREIFDWHDTKNDVTAGEPKIDHPLLKMQELLDEFAIEDDALAGVHQNFQNLISVLRADQKTENQDMQIYNVTPTLDLVTQFKQRQVYTVTKDDSEDRLTTQFWFPNYTFEAEDGDGEKMECDLDFLRTKFFPTFDLADELKKKFAKKRADDPAIDAAQKLTRRTIINTSRGMRRRFVPMRGRGNRDGGYGPRPSPGRGGGVGAGANRLNDPFRNRPPNTSRPPSMHVDDFVVVASKRGGARPMMSSTSNLMSSRAPTLHKKSSNPTTRKRQ